MSDELRKAAEKALVRLDEYSKHVREAATLFAACEYQGAASMRSWQAEIEVQIARIDVDADNLRQALAAAVDSVAIENEVMK